MPRSEKELPGPLIVKVLPDPVCVCVVGWCRKRAGHTTLSIERPHLAVRQHGTRDTAERFVYNIAGARVIRLRLGGFLENWRRETKLHQGYT